MSEQRTCNLERANLEHASVLVDGIVTVCAGASYIDIIAAAHSVTCHAIGLLSPDLPSALENADRLAADMKDLLRKKLGN